MRRLQKILLASIPVVLLLLLLTPFATNVSADGAAPKTPGVTNSELKKGPVFIIPVDQKIERGLQSFWKEDLKKPLIMEQSLFY